MEYSILSAISLLTDSAPSCAVCAIKLRPNCAALSLATIAKMALRPAPITFFRATALLNNFVTALVPNTLAIGLTAKQNSPVLIAPEIVPIAVLSICIFFWLYKGLPFLSFLLYMLQYRSAVAWSEKALNNPVLNPIFAPVVAPAANVANVPVPSVSGANANANGATVAMPRLAPWIACLLAFMACSPYIVSCCTVSYTACPSNE